MPSLSVIVPMLNVAGLAARTLSSADEAIAHFRRTPEGAAYECEVVVVDDGSTDGTRRAVEEHSRGRDEYLLVMRGKPSSPSCARNAGVLASRGDLLFFLDGDDAFLEAHLLECVRVMDRHPDVEFVKTGVALSDAVHPDWRPRIANSLVLNMCIRRASHEAVGGFPDLHLFRRRGDRFDHVQDVFRMYEDVFYNKIVGSLFRGRGIAAETVVYHRRPGNSFDRQYEKFLEPPGEHLGGMADDDKSRVRLCRLLAELEIETLKRRLDAGRTKPEA